MKNELRIGSIVKQGTIKTFYEQGIHIGGGRCFNFGELEPEPINKDWLLKVGFKLFDDGTNILQWRIDVSVNTKLIVATLGSVYVVHIRHLNKIVPSDIKYTHQLQNAYNVLTGGKELA